MPLSTGRRLGPYEIVSAIGAGGMGEVYRARDTRLDRMIAIKTLPDTLSRDVDRRSRFQREARAIAALSHPHICALHDIGEHDGVDFLVMELLEGETLSHRLAAGPLPVAEAVTYAIQIADALANAHRQGIVHRDLKPGNVMLTRSGAKLLDFGLAKLKADIPGMHARTMTAPMTEEGQILGTLNYMAPEQLEGRTIDSRTDVFAFGAVLFEMLSGRLAFDGAGAASVIGHILHTDPPTMTELVPAAPPALARLISVCLAKDPDDRWSSAHDVLLQLKALPTEDEARLPVLASSRSTARLAWSIAAIAAIVAIALGIARLAKRPAPETSAALDMFSVLAPSDAIQPFGDAPQISSDGRQLAFIATDRAGLSWLYVRPLDSEHARPLPGTEGAALPFWAPDSRRLAFFAHGQLKTTSIDAETPNTIAEAPVPRGGTWNQNDIILFSPIPSLPLRWVSSGGGATTDVPRPAGAIPAIDTRWFPSFLPDGKQYLFLGRQSPSAPYSIMVGALDSASTRPLVQSRAPGTYAPPGYLLFRREGTLVAQPFDASTAELKGIAVPVADKVGFNVITYQALVSASATGRLAYQSSIVTARLNWYDRTGTLVEAAGPEGGYNTICLTPDDRRVVYDLADDRTGDVDIWTRELTGGPASRLTFNPAVDFYPVCPRSGDAVVFATLREGPPNLFRVLLNAPGSELAVLQSPVAKLPNDVSRDGRLVVFSALQAATGWDIFVMTLPNGSPTPFAATPTEERTAQLSPDSRWIAYVSNESQRAEVYVQPFPATGAKWQVSTGGGEQPQWRQDGRELYYVAPDKKLMAVDIKSTPSNFVRGEPRVLMETRMTGWERLGAGCCQYAPSKDGRRFLISTATSSATPITVVVNWQQLMRRE
jgi:serine/threonine protein kinase